MNTWEMLGIAPTTDVAAIKKAYAARAKEYHPEEHPEEYQKLRAAYKMAVQYAKRKPVPIYREYVEPLSAKEEPQKEKPQSADTAAEPETPEPAPYYEAPPKPPKPEPGPEPESEQFCFEEVDRYLLPEETEWFYREFEYISWNPYLINNPLVWRCLCSRPESRELLADAGFRLGLAERICRIPMMRREAFEFWDCLFADYGDEVRAWKQWGIKQRACARESLFHRSRAEQTVTREERDMHYKICAYMQNHQMNNRLKSMSSVEDYLTYYLPYAGRHHREMEKRHRSGSRARIVFDILIAFSVVMILIAVIVNIDLYRQKDSEAEVPKEPVNELQINNESSGNKINDNDIIDDEVRIQVRDTTWKDALERYEAWQEKLNDTETD